MAATYAFAENRDYYQRYTGISSDTLRRRLADLYLECAWGHPVDSGLAESKFAFSDRLSRKAEIRAWGARDFLVEKAARGLNWIFPNASFVHIYRNGIDVVYSMSLFKAYSKWPFEKACTFWAEHAERYFYLLEYNRAFVIRYEDFLNNPDNVFQQLLPVLGLSYEPGPSRYAEEWHVHPLNQTTSQISAKSVISARTPAFLSWSQAKREGFKRICGTAMEKLGYDIPF